MRKRKFGDGGEVDAMEEANNRSMVTPRKVSIGATDEESEDSKLRRRGAERSRGMQDLISSGADIVDRPQDEGYRPNAGTAKERAMAEGAYDSGKITESGDQGFGGPGSSRTVKATPKAAPKAAPKAESKPAPKAESKPAPKAASTDVTKMSLTERAKANRDSARSGSGTTDRRSVGERLRSAFAGKDRGGNSVDFAGSGLGMKRGGSVSSASRRADGIATKGKTKGTMVAMKRGGKC
jgi:hypothetical protein